MKPRLATVQTTTGTILVPITSEAKPGVPDTVLGKWQTILNLLCELAGIPSSLIMKLNQENIEVLLGGDTLHSRRQ